MFGGILLLLDYAKGLSGTQNMSFESYQLLSFAQLCLLSVYKCTGVTEVCAVASNYQTSKSWCITQ